MAAQFVKLLFVFAMILLTVSSRLDDSLWQKALNKVEPIPTPARPAESQRQSADSGKGRIGKAFVFRSTAFRKLDDQLQQLPQPGNGRR